MTSPRSKITRFSRRAVRTTSEPDRRSLCGHCSRSERDIAPSRPLNSMEVPMLAPPCALGMTERRPLRHSSLPLSFALSSRAPPGHAATPDVPRGSRRVLISTHVLLAAIYFTSLLLLCLYGAHRCVLVWLYFRHAAHEPVARERFASPPRVLVQLPMYNERYVAERLIAAVAALRWPRERLEIQVLDDSTDDTGAIAQAAVDRWRAAGVPIVRLHRRDRHGFKAGALQEGLARSDAELVAIFDADFVPDPDFLLRTVDFFTDPEAGTAQVP